MDFHLLVDVYDYARSYPRHACPLCVVVFMQVHDRPESAPVLAAPTHCDPF
jgi:hypothetical protein